MKGTVKWFNDEKGYGFIGREDGGKDVFVHYSAIERKGTERRTLGEGEVVNFELDKGPRGEQAVNVRRG